MISLLSLFLLAMTSTNPFVIDPVADNQRLEEEAVARELSNSCRKAVDASLAYETHFFRAVVYGQQTTAEAPIGAVRTDHMLVTWKKVGPNRWKTVDSTNPFNAEGDDIGKESEIRPIGREFDGGVIGGVRNSQFAVRDLPSAIVPALTQSVRAYECQMRSICRDAASRVSGRFESGSVPGCLPGTANSEFHGLDNFCDATGVSGSHDIAADMLTYCDDAVDQIWAKETALLTAAFEYHAAYTTLLQFAGNLDLFIEQWREPITTTLWQTAELTQELGRIPCFLSSCDASPTSLP